MDIVAGETSGRDKSRPYKTQAKACGYLVVALTR
jgi:hypothetical protein